MVPDPIEELSQAAARYHRALAAAERSRIARDLAVGSAFQASVPIRVIASIVDLTPSRVASILGHPMGRPGRPSSGRR